MGLLDSLLGPRAQAPGTASMNPLQSLLDPSVALPMAAALLGNQGNMANLGNAFAAAGPALQQRAQTNKTRAWLQAQGPEYAQLMDAGMSPADALSLYAKKKYEKSALINAGDGNLYDQDKKEWISAPGMGMGKPTDDIKEYQYAVQNGMFKGSFTDWQTKGVRDQDPTFGRERDTRKDYEADANVQNYKKVRDSFERVRTSATIDSGPGDMALIFNYMKMLDPGSVVREGEFATAQNSGGVAETVRNMYNRVISGERLSPEMRSQFVGAAESLYSETASNVEDTNQRYGQIATDWGLDPNRIVQRPETYQPLKLGQSRTTPDGKITIRRIGD